MKKLALLLLAVSACSTVTKQPITGAKSPEGSQLPIPAGGRAQPQILVMEPIKLRAVKTEQGTEVQAIDAATLFERAGKGLSAKRYAAAVQSYDRLLEEFPKSRFISPALYNAGLAHEWGGAFGKAAKRYQALIRRFGSTRSAVDAAFRLGGCYAELENWAASAQVFASLLSRMDLPASDRIEASARKGLAHFRLGDARACRSTLEDALRYHRKVEAVERLDSDFFLGMAHYYLAAIPHVEFRKLEIDAASRKLATELDEKARLLLVSQTRYIKTIKVKNTYWATASGFQIGSLYREFYRTLLTALPDFSKAAVRNAKKAKISPKEARKQLVQVYREEVHKAVKPLLHKAIRVFEKNVEMGERVGVQSNWVGKSRKQIQDLKHLLSLSPEKAVEFISRAQGLPEDQQGVEKPPASQPSSAPSSVPSPEPPPQRQMSQGGSFSNILIFKNNIDKLYSPAKSVPMRINPLTAFRAGDTYTRLCRPAFKYPELFGFLGIREQI